MVDRGFRVVARVVPCVLVSRLLFVGVERNMVAVQFVIGIVSTRFNGYAIILSRVQRQGYYAGCDRVDTNYRKTTRRRKKDQFSYSGQLD